MSPPPLAMEPVASTRCEPPLGDALAKVRERRRLLTKSIAALKPRSRRRKALIGQLRDVTLEELRLSSR